MKRTKILIIALVAITSNVIAQQIPLKGVVTVQNSKTYTGKIQYVKNAEATHPNAKTEVTDDDGQFTLYITGLKEKSQTQIAVIPYGEYADYVVVNEKELYDITLGRVTPVSVYISKKSDLEQRRAEMVDINMQKYRERIKQLQTELDDLKAKYDYNNPQYKLLENQIDSLSKSEKDMYSLVKEWAESLTTINLDNATEAYSKAYTCFANGELDSIGFYLPDEWLKQQTEQFLRQQEEGKFQIEAGQLLSETGQRNVEEAKDGLAEIVKGWMLKAKGMALENNYDLAISYFEEAICIDSLNGENIFAFAYYLHTIREYAKAEKYYIQCLEIFRGAEITNPKAYLPYVAATLNNLAALHRNLNEYPKALEEYEETLKIRRERAAENPKTYLPDVATTLNNLAILHHYLNEYPKALEEYEEALRILRELAAENPKVYLPDLAMTLNNFAALQNDLKEYRNALNEYEEALKIRRELAEENPKAYLPDVAITLNNLAILHRDLNDYPKALEEYEEALSIRRELVTENPKAILPDVAQTLNNMAILHRNLNDYPKALEEYEEALRIRRELSVENPKAWLPDVSQTLNNLAVLHRNLNDYPKALEEYEEALSIRRELSVENPKAWLPDVAMTLNNLATLHHYLNEYPKALEEYKEALSIRRELSVENPKAWLPDVSQTLNNLAVLHSDLNDYPKALEEYEEALKIRRELATENPKAYLPDVATTLNNLAILHSYLNDYPKAMEEYEEALKIRRKLAAESPQAPQAFLPAVVITLNSLAITLTSIGDNYYKQDNYIEAEKHYLRCMEIREELVTENPDDFPNELYKVLSNLSNIYRELRNYPSTIKYKNACNELLLKYQEKINYKPYLAQNYGNLSWYYLFIQEYAHSEQSARQALELDNSLNWVKTNLAHAMLFQNRFSEAEIIYKELAQTVYKDGETFTQTLLDDYEAFEKADVIPEECKSDVERIRKFLREQKNDAK